MANKKVLLLIITYFIILITYYLRYFWKNQLVSDSNESIIDEPIVINENCTEIDLNDEIHQLNGKRFLITGKFDHSKGYYYYFCDKIKTISTINRSIAGTKISSR